MILPMAIRKAGSFTAITIIVVFVFFLLPAEAPFSGTRYARFFS